MAQAITWTNVVLSSVRSFGSHMRTLSEEISKISILDVSFEIIKITTPSIRGQWVNTDVDPSMFWLFIFIYVELWQITNKIICILQWNVYYTPCTMLLLRGILVSTCLSLCLSIYMSSCRRICVQIRKTCLASLLINSNSAGKITRSLQHERRFFQCNEKELTEQQDMFCFHHASAFYTSNIMTTVDE